MAGYDYLYRSNHLITPFLGFGYRYLNNDSNNFGGYEREVKYLYIPIGVKTISPFLANWTWGIHVEYDLFLDGKVKSHLSDVYPALNDLENNQDFGDGYGIRVSLRFKKKLTHKLSLSVEPFVRYWDIEDSDISTITINGRPFADGYEPANNTTSYGLRGSFIF